MDVIGTET